MLESPWVCVVSLRVHWLPPAAPTVRVELETNLFVGGVYVSANGCFVFFFLMQARNELVTCPEGSTCPPMTASADLCDPLRAQDGAGIENGWMQLNPIRAGVKMNVIFLALNLMTPSSSIHLTYNTCARS